MRACSGRGPAAARPSAWTAAAARGRPARRAPRTVRRSSARTCGWAQTRSRASGSAGVLFEHLPGELCDQHADQSPSRSGTERRRRWHRRSQQLAVRRQALGVVDVQQAADRPAERDLGRTGRQDRRARGLRQIRPAAPAVVDVVEVEARSSEEAGEADVWPVAPQRSQLVDLGRPTSRDGLADAAQHDLRRLRVELHVAPGGKERESALDRPLDVAPRSAEQCPVAAVEAELACGGCPTKSSTVQNALPSAVRRPRPSCWRNSVGLSVGRSSSRVSTAGRRRPR